MVHFSLKITSYGSVSNQVRSFSMRFRCGSGGCCVPTKGHTAYLSTPIYYVNGSPHIGHAYTSSMSDMLARSFKMNGVDVKFLTGTDEHGLKVEQSAKKAQMSTIDFVDQNSLKFKDLIDKLGCSHDDFLRTTEDRHKLAVTKLWQTLMDKGDIYLGSYEGWYSVRDETFYTEKELVNGKAPTGSDVEWVKEESYFFRLSKYHDKLLKYYDDNPTFISPESAAAQIKAFMSAGLKDLSVSRCSFKWGIPVPGDPKHVVYVWLDALTNYLTAVGYPDTDCETFKKYWPATMHIVGKDIMMFHAVFWPAFLMAADLPLPKHVYGHGWWTKDGVKMSKSLGNVIDPVELIAHYGADYVRYFFAAEVPFGDDGNFVHQKFCERINSSLANNFGNLVNRVVVMINRHCDNVVPHQELNLTSEDMELINAAKEVVPLVLEDVRLLHFKDMCDRLMVLAHRGNEYATRTKPWDLAKNEEDKARLHSVLYVLAELIRFVAVMLQPVTPRASAEILDTLGVKANPEARGYASLTSEFSPLWGSRVAKAKVFFPRVTPMEEKKPAPTENSLTDQLVADPRYSQYNTMTLLQVDTKLQEVRERIKMKKAQKINKSELEQDVFELQFLKLKQTALQTASQ